MTREEAIDRLRDMGVEIRAIVDACKHMTDDNEKDMQALDMAIKALEGKDTNVPTKWIPVNSKKLPKPQKIGDKDYSETVFVTIKNGQYTEVVDLGYYCYSMKKWFARNVIFGKVVAWQPLPKPYEAVR